MSIWLLTIASIGLFFSYVFVTKKQRQHNLSALFFLICAIIADI